MTPTAAISSSRVTNPETAAEEAVVDVRDAAVGRDERPRDRPWVAPEHGRDRRMPVHDPCAAEQVEERVDHSRICQPEPVADDLEQLVEDVGST